MRTSEESKATVLVVDDMPLNISLLSSALSDEYRIKAAKNGMKAIDIARSTTIDIILLDVMMPEIDGFETCRLLKKDPMTRGIPVIFVTARGETENETEGFACGAVDYITKPFRAPVVRERVKTHLALHDLNRTLEERVLERTAELTETRLEILHRLGIAGEYRDNETGRHVVRVCNYSRLIGLEYGLPENEAELLYNVAALHDVGKIAVPDGILFKPGKLDEDEFKIIKSHCEIGHRIIGESHSSLLLSTAAQVALSHHEKWDGGGYPHGLKGTDIPLFCRIVAIADVFDALTTERPYKKAWDINEAVAEITKCSDRHFDPEVVEAFLRINPELTAIKEKFADTN